MVAVALTMSVSHASLVVSMYFLRASLPCSDTGVLPQHPIAGEAGQGCEWASQQRQQLNCGIQRATGRGGQRGRQGSGCRPPTVQPPRRRGQGSRADSNGRGTPGCCAMRVPADEDRR